MISNLFSFVNQIIESIGYIGIFLLMALESSFFPFPSEIVMIPAGFLASLEKYNLFGVILAGSLGSLTGALFNYYFAKRYGLRLLLKYGKYIGIKQKSIDKMMKFFETHGVFGTFIGRLLPGIRQYISLPAGMVNLPIIKFSFYTILGASIWVAILVFLGFSFGNIMTYDKVVAQKLTIFILINVAILILGYTLYKRLFRKAIKMVGDRGIEPRTN